LTHPEFQFRFFFDPGSGSCLWAGDNRTRQALGYAVDLGLLKISAGLRQRVEELAVLYDESIDWSDPGGGLRWTAHECARFNQVAEGVLASLREELSGFGVIEDEFERV
jgi:hypothetical protein